MKTMPMTVSGSCRVLLWGAAIIATPPAAWADLPANGSLVFQNLQKISNSYSVDDPGVAATDNQEGPKGLAAGDLDRDGRSDVVAANKDGTVAVLFGASGGGFEPSRHLATGDNRGLRDVIMADVDGDTHPEIVAAHPFAGKLFIFALSGGVGSRTFKPVQTVTTWPGARAVTAGDFNGDGKVDLAVGGAGDGFREFKGDGTGQFEVLAPVSAIAPGPFLVTSATPVFALQVMRTPGSARDQLAVTYAGAGKIWFLGGPAAGQDLQVNSELQLMPGESIYDIGTGFVSDESRVSGRPDLLSALTWSGEVFLRRARIAAGEATAYDTIPSVRLAVPGGPRALAIADVNGDLKDDLLVVSRTGNALSLFANQGGSLVLSSQSPAGSSPRGVVAADFDRNGLPDAAVINRKSEDITLHRIDPVQGWFYQSPLVQRIIGGAKAANILDINADGKMELIHLSGVSGEAFIRGLNPAGGWSTAGRYAMGVRPQTLRATDMDSDGKLDLVATSLGDSATGGGVGYRLQTPNGTFGPLVWLPIPPSEGGSMFADIFHDFDGDGLKDLVVGYYDCRVAFFQGTLSGLKYVRTEQFVYESRALSALDADQDGDYDLVGVGAYGDIAVVENDGKWFKGGIYRKILSGTRPVPGASRFTVQELNGDNDPDLMVYTQDSVSIWHGSTGLQFAPASTTPLRPTLDSVGTDFDGDGQVDIIALCPTDTTVSFFRNPGQEWWATSDYVPYSVPAVSTLAVGDLDGDGRPDLVGVGDFLWVALSGTPAPASVPVGFTEAPIDIPSVVINEVLASTTDFLAKGASEPMDCVEIFNGTGSAVDLAGWKLRCEKEGAGSPAPEFLFPSTTLQPREVAVVYCNDKKGAWSAPFKLPAEGCTLRLLQPGNVPGDVLTFPPQEADISYARLSDGASGFVYNPFPSIGSTNYDNGNTQPKVEIKPLDVTLLKLGKWRFRAKAWSASGMFTLMIGWKEITTTGNPRSGTIALFDDGMHDDGASLDGSFTGDWDSPLPPGSAMEFFLTGADLRGERVTEPEGPDFTPAGQPIGNYTMAVPATPSGWEISEDRADQRNGSGQWHGRDRRLG